MPTPTDQLVSVLAPLRSSPGGLHQITLALQPEGLGNVRATVVVGDQRVTVQMSADNPEGRDALRQSLPQLRQLLQGDGATGTTVTLSDGRGGHAPTEGRDRAGASASGTADGLDEEPTQFATGSPAGDGRLVDVRL